MACNGKEGGQISLSEGAAMTAAYRAANPGATKAHLFGKAILNDILAQDGCMGMRMYYGINNDGEKQLVLVGVDSDEHDMVNGIVADLSKLCPTMCDGNSPLNG